MTVAPLPEELPQSEEQGSIEVPLLDQESDYSDSELVCGCVSGRVESSMSTAQGTANLILTSVGAGLLSLPRAFANVGIFLGIGISIFVGYCTYVCCHAIVVGCARHKAESYGALVDTLYGRGGYLALQWSIIAHVYGVMIVYIVIIGDVLVGDGTNGIVPYVLGLENMNRTVTVAVIVFGLVTPMLVPRKLDTIGSYSRVSVYLILYVAGTMGILCATAVAQGVSGLDTVDVWPRSMSGLKLVLAGCTSFAVTALAFTCHFNLMAVHGALRDPRVAAMEHVMKGSSVFVTTLYSLVAVFGYLLFGASVNGDVLKDLTIEYTASVVGSKALACAAVGLSMVAYCCALLVNYVLKVWAVRNALVEVFLRKSEHDLHVSWYYCLTMALVVSSFAISTAVPSVFFFAALIGSTACSVFSYFFPGMLMIRRGSLKMGYSMVTLSLILAITGTIHTILDRQG